MKCDCKSEVEAKLKARFIEKAAGAKDHQVELQGYGLVMSGSSMDVRGYMPVETTALFTLKSGATKRKTSRMNMFFSFCPFCGKPAVEAEPKVTGVPA